MNAVSGQELIEQRGLQVGDEGQLLFDGCSLEKLAQTYGTPCYIYSENSIRRQCRAYVQSFQKEQVNFEVIYAGKAFLVKALCRILDEEGLGIDAASGGEIYTALNSHFPAQKIYFHGNNKSEDEIRYAITSDIGMIMIDNLYELEKVNQIAGELNKSVNIMLRVIPGVDTHTHAKIRTGQVDSKFGIPIGKLLEVFPQVLQKKHLVYQGLHCHIGSQLLEASYHLSAVGEMVQLIKKIADQYQVETHQLNLGGGLGVKYSQSDNRLDVSVFVNQLVDKVKEMCQKHEIKVPKILIEPGRSIVAEAGITLYRIGAIKDIPQMRKYLIVDGGMSDNMRPTLYDAQYEALLVNKFRQANNEKVTIAGKFCESGDILIKDIFLPKAENGDLLAVFTTGAYHYSMASNYNCIPKLPVILVNKGKSDYIVQRQTYQDMTRNEVLPVWMSHSNAKGNHN